MIMYSEKVTESSHSTGTRWNTTSSEINVIFKLMFLIVK